ncbi:MAG: hypothetical protein II048_04150 [Bacteroidales bacterium]|nr:hypothetical protein [Bacteroidales bacterium]
MERIAKIAKIPFQLITTDHLVDRLWFLDDEDYKAGMNGVAVTAYRTETGILSFILMSNHVHFVICGTQEKAEFFIDEYKRHHSAYLQRRYGFKEYLRRNDVDYQQLEEENESLEKAVAYVQMNSVAANICLHPTGYPWGTGNAFFKTTAVVGRRIGSLSARSQIKILQSKTHLPENYLVSNGYVLPESFVQVPYVESIFRTPARFNYFLVNSSKAKRRLQSEDTGMPAFRDQSILAAIPDLCHSLFQKTKLEELNWYQQAEIAKQLRRRFSSEIHQLARVIGLPYPEIAKMLDIF